MRLLAKRAWNVYQNEGILSVVGKSSRYLTRAFTDAVGERGLYNSDKYIEFLRWTNTGFGQYDALADPYKIVAVDPADIEYVTGRGPNPGQFQWQDVGKVTDGSWDQSDERVEELPVVRALRQRFEEDTPWEELEFIQRVKREAKRGNPIWRGCTSLEDVERACERVDELYRRIQTGGYRSKCDLLESGDIDRQKSGAKRRFEPYDEVVVDIGREGEFLFVDGRHRLAIARILDLQKIPVRISARHAIWQQKREIYVDESNFDEIPDQHRDHPDLQDIISDSYD